MARVFVKIELNMNELIYDVENKTSLTGNAHDNGQNYKESADMRATEVDEHRNQVMRSIGNAWATLKSELHEYLCASGTTADNIQLGDWDNLVACLAMPTNYDLATKDAIATGMHQYIVNMALTEWFNIFSKTDAAEYLKMAAANMQQIHRAINRRVRPQRRPVCCCN